jgi:hypothetical protein
VEKASDVLCALWLARRSGLFRPNPTIRGSVGTCSRANAAYKRHLAARGNAQRVALEATAAEVHERLARQARSWGVELSV